MTDILQPGSAVLFMKIGTHAGEGLDEIIERKLKEIDDEGFAMWGYGGNTCHPRTMVQPFAEEYAAKGQPIYLCMNEMTSRHFAEPIRAADYSSDGAEWMPVPAGIHVRGSRFALCIRNLHQDKFDLSLNKTRVAVGNQRGRVGSRYIQGQVDKACLEVVADAERSNEPDDRNVTINLVAELQAPYAVFLRT